MAKLYDIAERLKIGNIKPEIKIDETHIYKINTSKSAVLFIQAVSEDKEITDAERIDKIITIALGTEALNYLNELDASMQNFNLIITAIMAAAADITLEEAEELTQEENRKSQKKSK